MEYGKTRIVGNEPASNNPLSLYCGEDRTSALVGRNVNQNHLERRESTPS